MNNRITLTLLLLLQICTATAQTGWWPALKAPKEIVTCTVKHSDIREMNLAQSVAGLAAQAVNEGSATTGVWIKTRNKDYTIYFNALLKRLHARNAGVADVWTLVERFKKNGVIKGYILYDTNSINLATVYAGISKGILIDRTQEALAKSKGLVKLYDAGGTHLDEAAFRSLQPQLNNHVLVIANPKFSNNRDYAIAQKSMVYYGVDSLLRVILSWVKPLSPVIGWNKGDEFKHIEPCSRYGLINTATDWCVNLSLLSIASVNRKLPKIKILNPATIGKNENKNYHAFVMSDGDNMQWTFGNFLRNPEYWNNPNNTSIPMSFTTCVLNLAQAGQDVYEQLVQTQPRDVSVVEYGGGYYYPDLFAKARPGGAAIFRNYAAMIDTQMKRTGTKVFGFICKDVSSPAAMEAYKIFAEEIEDLTGMIAVQYSPYNGGGGKIFWVKNKKGIEIPVVTARYQLWVDLPRPGSGGPAALAQWINNDSTQFSWTIVHAWSSFDGQRGVTPVKQTKDLIDAKTKLVSIEELLWRLRLQRGQLISE